MKPKRPMISEEVLDLIENRRNITKQHTYTSDRKQFNTREIRKKLKRDRNNCMEQQCKEAEEAFKTDRMQEVYNKVKLLSEKFELKFASIKDSFRPFL